MRISINECKHCGVEYRCQWSGPSMPGPYNDRDYCEGCKKAIVDALNAIPKKFGYQFVETKEVSIQTILQWEEDDREEARKKALEAQNSGEFLGFPMIRRVFASLMDAKTGEMSKSGAIKGRGEFSGRSYHYSYFPSKIEEGRVTVEKKVNLETGQELEYKMHD
jgi:hypothetical protein